MFELVDKQTGVVVATGKASQGPEVERDVCKMIARGDLSARAIEQAVKKGSKPDDGSKGDDGNGSGSQTPGGDSKGH